jgi:hypothetical protein
MISKYRQRLLIYFRQDFGQEVFKNLASLQKSQQSRQVKIWYISRINLDWQVKIDSRDRIDLSLSSYLIFVVEASLPCFYQPSNDQGLNVLLWFDCIIQIIFLIVNPWKDQLCNSINNALCWCNPVTLLKFKVHH